MKIEMALLLLLLLVGCAQTEPEGRRAATDEKCGSLVLKGIN